MAERFTLSRPDHLAVFLGILAKRGSICPSCGFGTRVTSKRWAKCKKCGTRVERKAINA